MNDRSTHLTGDFINVCYESLINSPASLRDIIGRGVLNFPRNVVSLSDFDHWESSGPRKRLSHYLKKDRMDFEGPIILADPFYEVRKDIFCDEILTYKGRDICALYKFNNPSESIDEISDYFSLLNYFNPICFVLIDNRPVKCVSSLDDLFTISNKFFLLAFDEMDFIEWTCVRDDDGDSLNGASSKPH